MAKRKYVIILLILILIALCAVGYSDWIITGQNSITPSLKIPIYINKVFEFDYMEGGIRLKDKIGSALKLKDSSGKDITLPQGNEITITPTSADFFEKSIIIGNTYSANVQFKIESENSPYILAGFYTEKNGEISLPSKQSDKDFVKDDIIIKYKTVQIGSATEKTIKCKLDSIGKQNETISFLGKYKKVTNTHDTAYIVFQSKDSAYYTIEDALAKAQQGDYVKVCADTSFSSLSNDITGYDDDNHHTVKSGVTLVMPFEDENVVESDTIKSFNKDTGKDIVKNALGAQIHDIINTTFKSTTTSSFNTTRIKIELTIPDNMTLTNKGTITIGGATTGSSGGLCAGATTGSYTQITLGKNSKIESLGDINAYGFIVEKEANNGAQVTMNSGTILMPFIVVEHRGGSIFAGAAKNLQGAPFNRFFFQNVTSKLVINSNANLYGWANLHASDQDNTTAIKFIGNSNGHFLQLGASSRSELKYDTETRVTSWDICGDAYINALSMEVVGTSVSTKDVLFPISWYWNINLKPSTKGGESTVTSNGQNIKIMPGGSLTIGQGVTFNVGKVFIYEDDDKYKFEENGVPRASYQYQKDKYNGKIGYKTGGRLFIEGFLNVDSITGRVDSIGNNAQLNIKIGEVVNSYELLSSSGTSVFTSVAWTEYPNANYNIELRGPIYNPDITDPTEYELGTLTVGTYISQNSGWTTSDRLKKITFDYDGGVGNKESVLVLLEKDSNGNLIPHTIGESDLPNAKREHYTFDGWYVDSAFNTSAMGQSMSSDITLYAKWIADTYTITYIFPNLPAEDIDSLNITNNNPLTYTYNTKVTFSEPTYEKENVNNWTFVGWYTSEKFDIPLRSLEIGDFGDIIVYGEWTQEEACTYYVEIKSGNTKVTIDCSDDRFDENGRYKLNGKIQSGTKETITAIYAECGTFRDVLNSKFMNSDKLDTIKEFGQYNFDSYFVGWKLTYTDSNGVPAEIYYDVSEPPIEISGGATNIVLTARWEQKACLVFEFFDIDEKDGESLSLNTEKYFNPGFEIPELVVPTLISSSANIPCYDYREYMYSGTTTVNSILFLQLGAKEEKTTLTSYFKRWFTIKYDATLEVDTTDKTTIKDVENNTIRVSTTEKSVTFFSAIKEDNQYLDSISSDYGTISGTTLNVNGVDSLNEIIVSSICKDYITITIKAYSAAFGGDEIVVTYNGQNTTANRNTQIISKVKQGITCSYTVAFYDIARSKYLTISGAESGNITNQKSTSGSFTTGSSNITIQSVR